MIGLLPSGWSRGLGAYNERCYPSRVELVTPYPNLGRGFTENAKSLLVGRGDSEALKDRWVGLHDEEALAHAADEHVARRKVRVRGPHAVEVAVSTSGIVSNHATSLSFPL